MPRPREFNEDEVVDAALELFWDRGYRNATLSRLTHATRLQKGSLYGAFSDKHSLFLQALERYIEMRRKEADRVLAASASPLAALRSFLHGIARDCTGRAGKRGCLVSNTTLELLPEDEQVGARIRRNFKEMQAFIARLIARSQEEGEIRSGINPQRAARLILTVIQGLRVLGKTSQTREEARATVDLLLDGLT